MHSILVRYTVLPHSSNICTFPNMYTVLWCREQEVCNLFIGGAAFLREIIAGHVASLHTFRQNVNPWKKIPDTSSVKTISGQCNAI